MIKTKGSQAVGVLFFAMVSIILLSIFTPTKTGHSFGDSPIMTKILTILLAALGLPLTILIFRKIKDMRLNKKMRQLLCVFSVLICGILVFLFSYYLTPQAINGFDSSNIYDLVNKTVNHLPIGNVTYFNVYPHNLAIALFYLVPAKIANMLGETNVFLTMVLVTDIAVISSAILLMASLSILFKKDENVFLFGLFGVILLPVLAYSAELYTDSISLFFVSLSLYLYLLTKQTKHKYLVWVLFSIASCLSVLIKVTTAILLIAIFLSGCLGFTNNNRKKKKRKMVFLLLFVIILGVFYGGYGLVKARILPDAKNMAIPKTHWVMMGLQGDGGYLDDDFNSTIANGPDRVGYNIRIIKERLADMGPFGYMGLLVRKISATWGDGSYNLSAVVSGKPRNINSVMMKFFYCEGDYFRIYRFFVNLMQVSLVLALFAWGVLTIRQSKQIIIILKLSIIGIFLFLLVWETISRYLVSFLPVLIISARYSFEEVDRALRKLQSRLLRKKVC